MERVKDIRYEFEETPVLENGRIMIDKILFVLFHDYSQTVVTAHYDREEPYNVSLVQRHEAPPAQPRQDQLEDFQTAFGEKIFNGGKAREGTVVGDGEPMSLIKELFSLVHE